MLDLMQPSLFNDVEQPDKFRVRLRSKESADLWNGAQENIVVAVNRAHRGIDFVRYTCNQEAQRCHFVGLDKLGSEFAFLSFLAHG